MTRSVGNGIPDCEKDMRKGIIFDLDGVICFTDKYHYQAWKQLANRINVYFDEKINDRLRGVSRMESLNIILERSSTVYSEMEKEKLAEEKNEIYKKLLMKMTEKDLSEEVKTTLAELRRRNVLMAIGSSSKNASLILKQIGLDGFFDAVCDGNCIRNSKPDPEVFVKAAGMLGLGVDDCYVVEDAEAGIQAAHAGHMKAVAIGDIIKHVDAEYKIGRFRDLLNIIDEGCAPANYDELLQKLRENCEVTESGNLKQYRKKFLGEKRGFFDPLVFRERAKPDKQYQLADEYCYQGVPIGRIRQTDGWNNFDISDGIVITETLMIPVRDKKIKVESYYKEHVSGKKKPCLVFFHGGGFISGSIDAVRNICKGFVQYADICVMNVDYSLAPEFPYPQAIGEGSALVRYLYEHADSLQINKNAIGVAGDSAGGNLAGAVTLRDRRTGRNFIKYQALIYPVVVLDEIQEQKYCPWSWDRYEIDKSDTQIAKAILYIKDSRMQIRKLYLGETSADREDVSLICDGDCKILPPTMLVTAEYDYLRIQDEAYARRLAGNDVDVKIVQYEGMDHAFLDKIGYYPQAEDCVRIIAKDFEERGQW